ncbi:AT-hook motif nuclear-localized protein 28-like [Lotus japonicus]|uniref:AT-hook motif nuclear-localized protein 28-like n=1 Tax=Lotus japonicus TaxID=34305 RepID=UPI002590E75C|nr:AT-hook motif nuclear-localized protein 28-like [Lotus japonicus]
MVENGCVPCISPTSENGSSDPKQNPTPPSQPQPQPTYEPPTIPQEELNTPPPSKKPRGRPLGSKNKLKSPIINNNLKPVVFQIPPGNDVIASLINYARCHQVNLTILSASGIVSDIHICHPFASYGPPLIYRGLHMMLSLSGTYINFHLPYSRSTANEPPYQNNFTIHVSGSQGAVWSGIVAGKVLAASPIAVNALVFKNFGYKALYIDGNMLTEEGGVLSSSDNDQNLTGSTSIVVNNTNNA